MYSYLQKLAVGLEQVALDQIIYDGVYDEEFNLAEYRLKGVSIIQDIHNQISLCNELQVIRLKSFQIFLTFLNMVVE